MGFFSGLTDLAKPGGLISSASGILGGGGQQQSQSSSQSGFSQLPSQLQQPYLNYGDQLNNLINSNSLTGMFTPNSLSTGEQNAIQQLYQGFTPTASSLSSDINMQMNPYDQSVIDTINRQANGQMSLLNQESNNIGQMGSNRDILGANDIDLTRQNQIGTFKQGEYNTALQNALTTLPQLRQQGATDALAAGSTVRGLNQQTNEAPLTALQAYGQALGIIPSNGGSTSSSTGAGFNSTGGSGSNLLSTAATALPYIMAAL